MPQEIAGNRILFITTQLDDEIKLQQETIANSARVFSRHLTISVLTLSCILAQFQLKNNYLHKQLNAHKLPQ